MDQPNLQHANSSSRVAQPPPDKQDEKTIPLDGVEARPAAVSRQPINIGAQGAVVAPLRAEPPRPAPPSASPLPKAEPPRPTAPAVRPAQAPKVGSGERITGMKTFFAKLHAGSLSFLEEQIQGWLKENPGVTIKTTNVTTGEVQAKTTEANLIIVVWY